VSGNLQTTETVFAKALRQGRGFHFQAFDAIECEAHGGNTQHPPEAAGWVDFPLSHSSTMFASGPKPFEQVVQSESHSLPGFWVGDVSDLALAAMLGHRPVKDFAFLRAPHEVAECILIVSDHRYID